MREQVRKRKFGQENAYLEMRVDIFSCFGYHKWELKKGVKECYSKSMNTNRKTSLSGVPAFRLMVFCAAVFRTFLTFLSEQGPLRFWETLL